ncbi:MAG: hypothetical protein KJ063_21550 [Anaerolineae bacterium]|nr:hypothetical protein [Anaerolineae bacterium]
MSATALPYRSSLAAESKSLWIYNQKWDLAFISLSVLLVPIPYLTWIFMDKVLGMESDIGRQAVNLLIAIFIGGPHMYATFTRTAFDEDFRKHYRGFVRSSIIIPLVVITLALTNLTLLLTIFFFWASIHVLHQIVFIVESYNAKAGTVSRKTSLSPTSKLIDYAVVLTSLYPIASYRIAITQDFAIGPSNLNDVIPSIFEMPWVVYAASVAFVIALVAFIIKTGIEIRDGTAHYPKVLFISVTVVASFIVPALGNLDTGFQGMNFWHSFQYLALTWYINRLRLERGELNRKPMIQRISRDGKARAFYGFNMMLTFGTGVIIGIVTLLLHYGLGGRWDNWSYAFETAYYIGVLSILWIHYYHDHFLFTNADSVVL